MPTLSIRLLGGFQLLYQGEVVKSVNQARLLSLLAYLAMHRQTPQPRQHLAFLLWPDVTEGHARANLRKLLYDLRHTWPDCDYFLDIDAQILCWRQDAQIVLDIADLEAVLARWEKAEIQAHDAVEGVLAHYRGELLPNCYDDWILPLRRALHERVINGLENAIDTLEGERAYATAINCAEHLLRLDPLHETTYRQLMRLHALSSNRAKALRTYHECATVLERELGVSPSASTRAVHAHLLKDDLHTEEGGTKLSALPAYFPLVGRTAQWAKLQVAWQQAHQHPHMVVIEGEAGTGKSRLALELARWVQMRMGSVAYARCYAAEGSLAYAPITEWLRSETLYPHLAKLSEIWQIEVARLLPEILAGQSHLPPSLAMTEGWQRQRFHDALVQAMLAAPQPLLVVLDDLQWCDEETLRWLHYFLRTNPHTQLLVVGTVRTDEIKQDHFVVKLLRQLRRENLVSELELEPLNIEETVMLARHMSGELTDQQAAHLYRETEGNPLFIVETVRMGLLDAAKGQGMQGYYGQKVPPTVQSVIAARLAQLSLVARQLVQIAAAIGRNFTAETLAGVSGHAISDVVQALDELWQRRIVREAEGDSYDFSHDKIREVAYTEISRGRRRLLHYQIAETLIRIHAQNLDAVCGQLAVHFEQGGSIAQAIPFYRRAGEVARRISAHEDAIKLFTYGLQLLQRLPESEQRDAQEVDLQTALGVSLVYARGYHSSEVSKTYHRVLALRQQLNQPPGAPELRGLALTYMAIGAMLDVQAIGRQLLLLSQQLNDLMLKLEGHYLLGVTFFWMGEFAASRAHLQEAVSFYNPSWHQHNIELYSHDSGAICLVRLGFTLWTLGYPEQALACSCAALEMAQVQNHFLSLAYVHSYSAWIHRLQGDLTGATANNEALLALCRERGLPYWPPTGLSVRGELLVAQGEIEIGLQQIQSGLAGFETESQNLHRPYIFALAAQAYGAVGNVARGLVLIEDALVAAADTKEHFWDAELYRLRGTLKLSGQIVHPDEVEVDFQQALAVAQNQQAKSLELRAATSLAQLWQAQGRVQPARDVLTPIYKWFSEGFDTADLRAAREVLALLA